MRKLLSIAFLLALSSNVLADPAWYIGTIKRVWVHDPDGGFVITYEGTSSISDCQYGYAYFTPINHGPDRLKASLSLALSAFHSGATVGIIIDKDANGVRCEATGIDLRK
ncbi:hypothetical protein [Microbulbifer sp. TYP-18]|uniref:hypothetical protein n=1 Tax=Microbulbifer sp. TYP-18 TaxID=3230024 RepID=UPI0034C66D11